MSTEIRVVESERDARIVWSMLAEPGDETAARFIGEFDDARDAVNWLLLREEWPDEDADDAEYREGIARWRPRLHYAAFAGVKATIERLGITVLIPGDPHWPVRLGMLGFEAPLVLYVWGDASLLSTPCVGVVGSRAASGYGEHVTMEMTAGLVSRGYTVVSGAAYGIDGMAHRAALASGGKTVAVLAGAVDRFYPAGHSELLDRIKDVGAVVSELPPGSSPTRERFLQRNRIIAALSAVVVVVEAGFRSGSLNTAGHAMRLHVPLGAVPGPVTSVTSAGCHRLIREHGAKLVTDAADVAALDPESGV